MFEIDCHGDPSSFYFFIFLFVFQALDVRVCEIVMGIRAQIAANSSAQDKSVDTYRHNSFYHHFFLF